MTIRTILADDEVLARDRLRFLLQADKRVDIVAECRNGRETIAAVDRHRPDLLLLDIEMPGQNGIAVAEQMQTDSVPFLIFVTAYPQYATKAFDVEALDYLVKPIEAERLRLALDRTERSLTQGTGTLTSQELRSALKLLKETATQRSYPARLLVPNGIRHTFVDVSEIDWIEAADYYACLHVGRSKFMLRETISQLSKTLDPSRFLRVHRSAIVNVGRVKEMVREGRSEMFVVLANTQRVKLSRSGWDSLSLIGGHSTSTLDSR